MASLPLSIKPENKWLAKIKTKQKQARLKIKQNEANEKIHAAIV